eukprot:CAMPEP_0176171868 /NCGR_PEP_ID=MMETSP0120_2-20121206/88020_1 /TAXON_ID=160619 /ORGANISM="Kryptoperidinium foliaceum, Strain CCMP 1326" /LENGTH=36 /DNA_ID= /DNA_START= /DNA_END= /DNA_ORIENTATION=
MEAPSKEPAHTIGASGPFENPQADVAKLSARTGTKL